jgi:nicotinic acid phosphoribosyltransferase
MKEIKDPEFVKTFIKLILPKVEDKELYKKKIEAFFKTATFDFKYSVYKEEAILPPKVPAFQFKGPKWIGQLIETPVTNIINGNTGFSTYRLNNASYQNIIKLYSLVNGMDNNHSQAYLNKVRDKAKEYRAATSKPIMDASYRRAPSAFIATEGSLIAMQNNWNGTSNVKAFFEKSLITDDMIGGTMAHAFIMSFSTEIEAFKVWNKVFPGSSLLIDTYDTIKAVKMLIKHNIKPESIRIDSGDFRIVCRQVRKILDEAILINGGFVYKVVEYKDKTGKIFRPEKKAEGKTNYPGLKKVSVKDDTIIITSYGDDTFGIGNVLDLEEDYKIKFDIRGELNAKN